MKRGEEAFLRTDHITSGQKQHGHKVGENTIKAEWPVCALRGKPH